MNCIDTCRETNRPCEQRDCRMWVDYPPELNCCHETVEENGRMTLREVAERLNISYVRVKQIEDKALGKLKTIYKEN